MALVIACEARSGRCLPPGDIFFLYFFLSLHYNSRMPKKLLPGSSYRKSVTLSFDPDVIRPFRLLCERSGITLSRFFEEVADVFVKSVTAEQDLKSEYRHMLALYYRDRCHNRTLPLGMSPDVLEDDS